MEDDVVVRAVLRALVIVVAGRLAAALFLKDME
jgi:hypothetical protein